MAVGSVPLSSPIDPANVSVSLIPDDGSPPLKLLVHGEPLLMDEDRAKSIISKEDIEILIELGVGNESAQYWTCDFSHVRSSL
jgi:glutamate N-acetyltransferase / amino-acid N-acetyltransferase